jgi:hypothetical protein
MAASAASAWLIKSGLTLTAAIGGELKRSASPENQEPSGLSSVKPDGSIQFNGLFET